MRCGKACWTRLPCPQCGQVMPPRGRSAPMGTECGHFDEIHSPTNLCHLWSEHDSTRHYVDPEGWAAHVASCAECAEGN
jgi:hypothetical protein